MSTSLKLKTFKKILEHQMSQKLLYRLLKKERTIKKVSHIIKDN